MALPEHNLLNELKSIRGETTIKIDNVIKSIENSLKQMKDKQNMFKQQIMVALGKLKPIAEMDISK